MIRVLCASGVIKGPPCYVHGARALRQFEMDSKLNPLRRLREAEASCRSCRRSAGCGAELAEGILETKSGNPKEHSGSSLACRLRLERALRLGWGEAGNNRDLLGGSPAVSSPCDATGMSRRGRGAGRAAETALACRHFRLFRSQSKHRDQEV